MTRCVVTHKNMMDSCELQETEEEAAALGSDARTVRKLTGCQGNP